MNKGSTGILSTTLTAQSSCGNVKQGWDERSVASGMKLLTPHFLSFPVLKLLLSPNVLYMCRPYLSSILLSRPTSTVETQHMPSRKRLLESHLFCLGSVLFVWTPHCLDLSKFTFWEGVQRETLLLGLAEGFLLRECVVISVSAITILFFFEHKSHVLKIPLMGIKV